MGSNDSQTPPDAGVVARTFGRLQLVLLILSGIGLLAMMVLVTANVITRNIFNNPIRGSFQIVETYLMPLSIFLGFSYAYETMVMPRLAFIVDKFPQRLRWNIHLVLSSIEMVVLSILFIFSLQGALRATATSQQFTVGGELWLLHPVMYLAPAGFLLVLLQVILTFVASIRTGESRYQVLPQQQRMADPL